MSKAEFLEETNNIRRAIRAFDPRLKAMRPAALWQLGAPKRTVKFALYLLDYAEDLYDRDQGQAFTTLGMAIGLSLSQHVEIHDKETSDLVFMRHANTLAV
jgi:hypothetical protein